MKRRRAIRIAGGGSLIAIAALAGGLLATRGFAAAPPSFAMPADYLAAIQVDVTNATNNVAADRADKATLAAQQWLHRTDAPSSIFTARASQYANSPVVDVVVVVYSTPGIVVAGPEASGGNGQLFAPDVSGVIVDAATGEVLKSFKLGRSVSP
jgi:hypothetical protein